MTKEINIIKKGGEVQNKEYVFEKLESFFSSMKNGKYKLKMTSFYDKRSNDQNSLMWLWFTCIEIETGTDKDDVHDYYCRLFLKRNVMINGKVETVTGGTSKLYTLQFKYFLDRVQADAASELGIKLPTREDKQFKEFEEEYKKYMYR